MAQPAHAEDEPRGLGASPGVTAAAAVVARLYQTLSDDMQAVEDLIEERAGSEVRLIPELADYLIGAGGKRLRPLVTVAAHALFAPSGAQSGDGHLNKAGDAHRKLAAAVEFIHTATLLHDDVVDGSATRRGKATANRVWSDKASVLVGDFLFARAFNLMVETGDLAMLDVLARASSIIAEGEVMQLAFAHDLHLDQDTYFKVIGAKTAELFASAAQVGAMAAGAPETAVAAARTYGRELGLAFQLVDDALDYEGDGAAMGKAAGDDFREGKLTLPVILALQNAGEEDRGFWRRAMAELNQRSGDFERALGLIRDAGALEATKSLARGHARRAADALSAAPDTPMRDALRELAFASVERVS